MNKLEKALLAGFILIIAAFSLKIFIYGKGGDIAKDGARWAATQIYFIQLLKTWKKAKITLLGQ